MKKIKNLTEGNISQQLKTLTLPMIIGGLGIVAFNLADAYFVGKLGVTQMAALAFTFPVVIVFNSITQGLGIGASAVISRAVGENDNNKIKQLTTDSLILGIIFSIIALTLGLLTIEPLFTLLGADEKSMPYIIQYMKVWYIGAPFVVIPMIGNSAIRALGDTKTPSMVMMLTAVTNIILDPILIFGLGSIPALGVTGAAIATVISRAITFVFAIYILTVREKVIIFHFRPLHEILNSWKTILYFGIPNAISKMILPIGSGIITSIIAVYGVEAVAGFGIATRIEFLIISVLMGLSSVIPVFVGQNYGAKRFDRISTSVKSSQRFSVTYGFICFLILTIAARPLSYLFTDEKAVSDIAVMYLRIVSLGYGFSGVIMILNGAYNAIGKPAVASALNLVQMLVIYIPMAVLLSKTFGLSGIFISLAFSYLLVGIISSHLFKKDLTKHIEIMTENIIIDNKKTSA